MKNLMNYVNDCKTMLDLIGIEYGHVYSWEINTRAKKRWGQTKRVPGGFTINISARLFADDASAIGLENTIIHELLHTCEGCFNHGKEWKALAEKVKREWGFDIKRCSTSEEKGVEPLPENIRKIEYKYRFECTGCGQVVKRQRKSDFVTHTNLYKCGRCGNKFKRVA